MSEFRVGTAQALGLRVRYYEAGEQGFPVILLHGGGTDSALLSWRLAIPALAKSHRVLAPDWPGYGESEIFRSAYSFEQMRAWLESLMDQWGLDQADLVGISMGGGGALSIALERPDRVRRLVLVDSYGLADRVAYHRMSYWFVKIPWLVNWSWALIRRSRRLARWSLAAIFGDARNISDELADEVFQAIQSTDGQRAFGEFQRAEMLPDRLRTCYMDRLEEIHSPTLVIHGERDTLVPLSAAREAARRIPGARLEVIPKAGHWPMREYPDQFNRLVDEFLSLLA
ncbi:MAG TPA: alpha/beta hydrolase [Anaerolinea sp.]|nr:alpha/beta hydrolase [Anaerolinea sp.]